MLVCLCERFVLKEEGELYILPLVRREGSVMALRGGIVVSQVRVTIVVM